MLNTLVQALAGKILGILSLIGKGLSYLAFWKLGKSSAKRKELENDLKAIRKARKIKDSVDNMSDAERRKWLRDNKDR